MKCLSLSNVVDAELTSRRTQLAFRSAISSSTTEAVHSSRPTQNRTIHKFSFGTCTRHRLASATTIAYVYRMKYMSERALWHISCF